MCSCSASAEGEHLWRVQAHGWAYIVMAYIVMARVVMAYIVTVYIIMIYVVTAHIVTAYTADDRCTYGTSACTQSYAQTRGASLQTCTHAYSRARACRGE